MRDETITALDALAALDPPANTTGPTTTCAPDDEVAAAIDRERAEIEATGAQRAVLVGAAIQTRRGLLLLFDVLVGITMGYLTHDQDAWTRRESFTNPHCGTFRCLAGWLAQAGFPTSRPAFGTTDVSTVEHVFPDGARYTIPALAVRALRDEPRGLEPRDGDAVAIVRMFSGGLDLEHVWRYAATATGGVVALPAALVDEVEAIDAARWLQ